MLKWLRWVGPLVCTRSQVSCQNTKLKFLRYWLICRKRWCPCSRRAPLHSSWLFDSVHPSSLCCHRYHWSCGIPACQRRDNELLWSQKRIQESRVCYGMAILLLTQHIGAVRGRCCILVLPTTDRPSRSLQQPLWLTIGILPSTSLYGLRSSLWLLWPWISSRSNSMEKQNSYVLVHSNILFIDANWSGLPHSRFSWW